MHFKRRTYRSTVIFTVFLAILFANAMPAERGLAQATQTNASARVTSATHYQLIGVYDLAKLNHILGDELPDFLKSSPLPNEFQGRFPAARYPVRLYKVTYASVVPELNNQPTLASGLVAVPETGRAEMPLVSYQHGTVFSANSVPSRPDQSTETRIVLAGFAAQGYVVIGADYFGRGDSTLPDTYLLKGSAEQGNYDMLVAAKAVLNSLGVTSDHQFLLGWSQGGWETMAFLPRLETDGVPVTAAAVASAPVDLSLSLDRWLNNPQPIDAVFLPGVFTLEIEAYSHYHQVPGFDAFAIQPSFLEAARDLYAGKIDFETFYARTPHTLRAFTRPEFRAMVASGVGPYWNAIDADQVYRWRLATPLRTFYGGDDEVTPYTIAMLPQQTQALLGGADTRAIDAGPKADHRAIFVRAVLEGRPWFDSFLTK
jgi:hypothetical protein